MSDYKIINCCFVVILFLGLSYCFFLKSIPEQVHLKSNCESKLFCKSVGLTRAFHSALHLNFKKASSFNLDYIYPLSFFITQFFYRFISILFKRDFSKKIIRIELIITISYFLFAFTRFVIP